MDAIKSLQGIYQNASNADASMRQCQLVKSGALLRTVVHREGGTIKVTFYEMEYIQNLADM